MLSRIIDAIRKAREKKECPSKKAAQINAGKVFKDKYTAFKKLLDSNAEFLNVQAEIEDNLRGQSVFGMGFVRSRSTMAVYQTLRMVQSLNDLTNKKYQVLFDTIENINLNIKGIMDDIPSVTTKMHILEYGALSREMVDYAGGKNANLGELKSKLGMPVPEGFAITTRVFYDFFQANDLFEEIKKVRMEMDPKDVGSITAGSEKIQTLILNARIPSDIEKVILKAYHDLLSRVGKGNINPGDIKVALRSSAVGEDSELSYAGQYVSFLNVTEDQLLKTYKFILAGLYIPRAIVYRLNKGIRDEDTPMSVACMEMVESRAAGVVYTRHPVHSNRDRIFINAVWGLGGSAVDGSVNPDTYEVAKNKGLQIQERIISEKDKMLVPKVDRDGLEHVNVPDDMKNSQCLGSHDIKKLAELALKIEQHYGCPQDIEWALDKEGNIRLLQARPINYKPDEQEMPEELKAEDRSEHQPLLKGGVIAAQGSGFGPCIHVASKKDIIDFPENGVLLARKSSPQYVMAMPRASAIITEAGSVTGHMASLAREFNVPTVLGLKNAMKLLTPGLEVTVDAYTGRVYKGRIDSILALKKQRLSSMVDTPVFNTLKKIGEYITPLNLADPQEASFRPENCETLHDIARFVHEVSYRAMFQLSDFVSDHGRISMKLDVSLPIDLYLIDLGGGIKDGRKCADRPALEDVSSSPLNALLRGMFHPHLEMKQPRPIEWKGLFSVMGEQLLNPQLSHERFGDRSYAIISDKYLNFSSRVGYHYAVLDSYCGENINKNYITFSFKGGAADDERRGRRVRAISMILEKLGFRVKAKADRVDSRFRKDEQKEIESRLDQLGRLLIFTRQMDMLMLNEHCVEIFAESFLNEDYTLECFYEQTGTQTQKTG